MSRNVIMNFTGTCYAQGLPGLTGWDVEECTGIEGCNCYCDLEAETLLADIADARPAGAIHWIDSGDYHYMSKIWMDKLLFPFNLLLLDNHPDMQPPAFGNILSCGGWLRTLLEGSLLLQKVVIAGIDPALRWECGGFGDRVRVVDRDGAVSPGECLEGLDGRPLYISVDKDVLSHEWARTDWDQGTMSLDFMKEVILAAGLTVPLIGADICGELSPSKGACGEDLMLNCSTNLEIISVLSRFLQEY